MELENACSGQFTAILAKDIENQTWENQFAPSPAEDIWEDPAARLTETPWNSGRMWALAV